METTTPKPIICPNCRHSVPHHTWMLHDIQCARRNYYCDACETVVPNQQREQHALQVHAQLPCDCGTVVEVRYMQAHKQQDCTNRLVPCEYCQCPLPFHTIKEHQVACGARTTPCELCGTHIQLQYQETHQCPQPAPQPENQSSVEEDLEERMLCPYCSQACRDYEAVQEHVFTIHPDILE